jgi:hypothetical protein
LSGRGGAWLRAAPAALLGVSLACLLSFVFVPSVMGLYESRGSPPVNVDSAALGLVILVANVVVFVLIVAAGWRVFPRRDR